ncbi:MAG: hypothetical protein ACYDEV_06285 [Acidiferrobacter sp.]
MKKSHKKRTGWARALGAGVMLAGSAVASLAGSAAASAGILPSMSEKPMTSWPMVYGYEKPEQKPTMMLFGVVQPGYSYIQGNNGNSSTATATGNAQFKLFRLRSGVRGSIGPNIDYYFLAQFENNLASKTQASVLDGSVTLNYIPGVHVEIGQMLLPFGEEGLTAAGVLPWINYSPATYNIDYNEFAQTPGYNGIAGPTGNGLFNAGRERGLMAFNQFTNGPLAVDYAVGLFNGTGVTGAESSMKHPDQALAHAGIDFGPFGLAASVLDGRQMISSTTASYQQQKYAVDVRYGNYTKDPLWLWYEYQHANDAQQPLANGNGTARGWFAAGGIRPVKHVMAVLRYSTYNSENVVGVTANPGPVLSSAFAAPGAGVTTSLNEDSLIGVYLARKGVRYYLEFDHTTFNNTNAPTDNAVSVMVSLPFGARLLP